MSASGVALVAAFVVLGAVLPGQAAWRLAGAREWAWAGPATGLAALLVIATVAVELPGEGIAGAAALGCVIVLAGAFTARGAPWGELAVVAVLALLVAALPFLAAGHVGILGVTDNGDLGGHIQLAESVRTGDPPAGLDPGWHTNYPTGSHALVASLATLAGTEVDAAFMGLLTGLVAVGALTALAALRELSPRRRVVGALLTGAPYLVAAYTVQASYKETLIGVLALGFALALPAVRSARAALPLVVIAAGAFVAYSFVGLEWPALIALAWIVLLRPGTDVVRRAVRPALVLGALLLLAVAPQLGRARDLVAAVVNTAQGESAGGNVRAELPSYEVFGIWPNADPRVTGEGLVLERLLALAAAAAFAYGAWWCWRRRRFELLAATAACLAVYVQARALSTPYYSGKALAIAAAPVMLVALAGLLGDRRRSTTLAAVAFVALAAWSSGLVLRGAAVQPPGHAGELKSLRPLLAGEPVFFFGRHDYIHHLLRGARVAAPYTYLGQSQVPFVTRPAKAWKVPQAFDWDAVDAPSLDRFRFVVAPRGAYASEPPPNWRRVRTLPSYLVYERHGPTPPRETLPEPDAPGAVLDCASPDGRAVAAGAGHAAVRRRPLELRPAALSGGRRALVDLEPARFAQMGTGGATRGRLLVPAGRWDVSLQYVSPTPVTIEVAGRRLHGRASLEGAGGFWHMGTVRGRDRVEEVVIDGEDPSPLFSDRPFLAGRLALTPAGERTRLVPLARACGRYVDWYRPG